MKNRKRWLVALLIIIGISFTCFLEYTQKKGYHEDEIYTMISSNHSIWHNGGFSQ